MEFARVINKKATQFRGPLFLALVFLKGVTYFYGNTLAMNFDFSRISKTNLGTLVDIYKGISSTTLLGFFSGTCH